MTPSYTPAPWEQAGWVASISTWTVLQLRAQDVRLTSALEEVRVRPWSALWRAPTNIGLLWLKACAPAMKHEVALIDFLLRLQPETLPPIYGLEMEQGLILMGDGGELLRSHTREGGDLNHWTLILPRYAALQRQAAPHVAELLAAGVVDRRLEQLPALYEDLLADEALLAVGAPHGLTPVEHAHLIARFPAFAAQCAELASLGIPATIDHSDFHDGNILIQHGQYRFIDWGDACVTHPFLTLLVTLRSIAYGLGLEENDPALRDLRDLYLTQWRAYGGLDDLRRALQLAQPLTMVNRALTWRRALATLPPEQHGEYADAVPGWLQEVLQAENNEKGQQAS
ncbi:MAG TPA: phosphotransferase [Caldilinea sp.]|mgnify:CR=1 FL=1|nr:phosphotransferase [Caldilinea sp.]